MVTVDHKARHVWTKTRRGIRCAYLGCNERPSTADVERLDEETDTASKMQITLKMKS